MKEQQFSLAASRNVSASEPDEGRLRFQACDAMRVKAGARTASSATLVDRKIRSILFADLLTRTDFEDHAPAAAQILCVPWKVSQKVESRSVFFTAAYSKRLAVVDSDTGRGPSAFIVACSPGDVREPQLRDGDR
jgi:hypothetical protein